MSRSIWKPVVKLYAHRNIRAIKIYPELLETIVSISNGKSKKLLTPSNKLIGHSLGEFFSTKIIPKFKTRKQ